MAKAKQVAQAKANVNRPAIRQESIKPEEKIARLLALLLIKDVKTRPEQAAILRRSGFSHREMSELLDTSENGVSVLLYSAKQKRGKKVDGAD